MNKKPIYNFDDTTSTGLDEVPKFSSIIIEDSDGNGLPLQLFLIDTTGITGATTVATLLATPALYEDISYLGVKSDVTGVTGADPITNMMSMTQAEYNAITPVAGTQYLIIG